MGVRHRVLVAAQPAAWNVLQRMLNGTVDLVPVHSVEDAFRVLDHEAKSIDLVISTIAFDDSRMVEFLQAVRRNPPTSRIPFLCFRVLPGVLSDQLVEGMRAVCKQCGAADLVDVAKLPHDAAQSALRTAVKACLESQ